jgi:hypothetical protein
MNSPLGKYSQVVAAIVALSIIGAYVLAVFFSRILDLEAFQIENLKTLALIAVGAVFGSAATINGVKAPLDSAHSRIDKIETVTGIQTHGAYVPEHEGIKE